MIVEASIALHLKINQRLIAYCVSISVGPHPIFEVPLPGSPLRNINFNSFRATNHICHKSYPWRGRFKQRYLYSFFCSLSFIISSYSLKNLLKTWAGAQKLARIRENSNFFRAELQKMGFEVLGDNDSPVMPIMLYNPAKIPAFSRECLRENVSFSYAFSKISFASIQERFTSTFNGHIKL